MTTRTILSGHTSSGLTVTSGNELKILSGGIAEDTTISGGGSEFVSRGGLTSGATVFYGGQEFVEKGGVASGTVVNGANENPIIAGQIVYGLTEGTVLSLGGTQSVQSGGVSSDTRISAGLEVVSAGGSAFGTLASESGDLAVYGLASRIVLTTSASEVVFAGGRALGTLATDGLVMVVGGTVSATILGSGSEQIVYDGGAAKGSIVLAGAKEIVEAGQGTVSSGLTIGETISSGGLEVVSQGGLASATTVSQGGVMKVWGDGMVSATHVLSGGIETVFQSGQASGTSVSNGYVFDYGLTSGTVIHAGGYEEIARHAVASGSMISSGGHEVVSSAGLVIAAAVFNGGSLVVSSGGSVSGGLTIHAGSATISGTMAAGQTVSFAGTAGDLKLDNLAAFGAAISGFGGVSEKIDLGGFAFATSETAKWSQSGTSGTLTVHDGAKSASLTLIGTYATGDFQLSTDGHGGTLIKDPTGGDVLPATTRFTQAAAGVEGGRSAAGLATVHAGGSALLGASPLVGVATSGR